MARKKEKRKAGFHELPNCFDRNTKNKGRWGEYFGNDLPIILELGCGKAEFSLALAKKYPERNYVGIDLKTDRMWYPASIAVDEGLSNLAFLWIHLLEIDEHFGEKEIDEIWITFPDPFPKARQAKHRMINPPFLEKYKSILKPDGKVKFKTDNRELFLYSLEVFVKKEGVKLDELSFDLHAAEEMPEDYKFKTTYEKEFLAMGLPINYVGFSFVDK
ncbi:MAG: tRNA (guanosine(46)-N7)-methyltransferase TrmB [Bacteroidia bacterium]|nr:tRNA (guanosine(46)-N7)-methyltransferase TrmB [Bacteroidia bacterium]